MLLAFKSQNLSVYRKCHPEDINEIHLLRYRSEHHIVVRGMRRNAKSRAKVAVDALEPAQGIVHDGS